jgi:hypothetical protein
VILVKPVFGVLVPAVLTLVVLWVLVRALEPKVAFFPIDGESLTPAASGVAFEALDIPTADGETLRAWWLPHDQPRATIVYFHGNGGNLSLWSPILLELHRRGYAVFAFDYRGYGVSTGSPSERGLYRDVDAVLRVAVPRAAPAVPLIFWGRSLGTALAAYAASRHAPDGLVLEAGFPGARALFAGNPVMSVLSHLSSYRFPTVAWMAAVHRPVLVIHGTADTIIPYRLGQQLYAELRGPKRFHTVTGGDHNDVQPRDPEAYWAEVEAFVGGLSRR